MNNLKTIEKLCKEYTDLRQAEIQEIRIATKSLPAMANLFNADAFIDCPMNDGSGDAIVVSEARPVEHPSSYKRTVVGLVATKENEPAVYRGLNLGVPTKFMKAMTQEHMTVIQTVEPIYHKDRVIGVFIIEQSIQSVRSFKQFQSLDVQDDESDEESYSGVNDIKNILMNDDQGHVADSIEEGLIFINRDNKVVFRNKSAQNIYKRLGFLSDILGKDYKEVCIAKPPKEDEDTVTIKQDVKLGEFYFTVKTSRVDTEDVSLVVTISDITTNKLQERELVLKSVAFHEMHHRVKNNLQTIAALLRLQRNNMESEDGKKALTDTITRILSIAATHQIMMETDVEFIQLLDIVAVIRENILSYYANDDFHLDIECHGGDFSLSSEKASAIALILNELSQNSIKYAFKDRKKGKITVMTMQRRAHDVELIYIDDGLGFDVSRTNGGGMGWTIIRSLVSEKLEGHIVIKSGPEGTKVRIVFPFE
ncbi:sensor histidine kinase [Anaerovoracaceae bacterium SGI.195]